MTNLVVSTNKLLDDNQVQQVTSYKYLGLYQTCEIFRRIGLISENHSSLKKYNKNRNNTSRNGKIDVGGLT